MRSHFLLCFVDVVLSYVSFQRKEKDSDRVVKSEMETSEEDESEDDETFSDSNEHEKNNSVNNSKDKSSTDRITCKTCGKSLKSIGSLYSHMKIHKSM